MSSVPKQFRGKPINSPKGCPKKLLPMFTKAFMEATIAGWMESGLPTVEEYMDREAEVARAFRGKRRTRWPNCPWEAYVAVRKLPEAEQDRLMDYHEKHGKFPGIAER